MLQRDKENLELRLQQLKEDAKEDFFEAQQVFLEEYDEVLTWVFSDTRPDLLSILRAYFEIAYVDEKAKNQWLQAQEILKASLTKVCSGLPVSTEKKSTLKDALQVIIEKKIPKSELYHHSEQIRHHPYFPLIEDMALDGDISKEEFYALELAFLKSSWDLHAALDVLPWELAKRIKAQIERYVKIDTTESEENFRNEYSLEIQALQKKWIATAEVITFVSRSYFKNPGRYKKYEHPKRRLKRTFKLALLRLLRKKLGMIDAENIMRRFEAGETFFELFDILREILDVLPENPQSYEIYTVSRADETAQDILSESQSIEEKILSWKKLTTSLSQLIGDIDSELDSGVLTRILDESTDFVGEDIYFRSESEDAWIFSDGKKSQESDDEDEDEEEKKYEQLSPRWAFETIKEDFLELDREKTKAFLEGRYDDIDLYNERLFMMQKKLEKLALILWEEL